MRAIVTANAASLRIANPLPGRTRWLPLISAGGSALFAVIAPGVMMVLAGIFAMVYLTCAVFAARRSIAGAWLSLPPAVPFGFVGAQIATDFAQGAARGWLDPATIAVGLVLCVAVACAWLSLIVPLWAVPRYYFTRG